jgi:hypothetical protein
MRSLLTVALLLMFGLSANALFPADCSTGTTPAIGAAINLTERCNRTLSCDICTRNDYSFDWLCCEDYGGRPAAYFVTGALIQVYFKNPYFTAFSFVFYEVLEKIYLQRYLTDFLDYESVMGSFVGDFFQGLAGMQFAAAIVFCFGLPPLIPSWRRAHRFGEENNRWILIALALAHILSVFFLLIEGVKYNWGLIVHACVQVGFLWVLNPFLVYGARVNELVWSDKEGSLLITPMRRQLFFFALGAALVAVEFMGFGWEFMANDWFQSWVVIGPLITLSSLIAIGISVRDHIYVAAVQFAGFLIVMLAVVFYYVGGALANTNYDIGALVLIIAGFVVVFASVGMEASKKAHHDQSDVQMTDVRAQF